RGGWLACSAATCWCAARRAWAARSRSGCPIPPPLAPTAPLDSGAQLWRFPQTQRERDPVDELEIGSARLRLLRGDITEQAVDAVVNAANSTLLGGGGVDGAIHRRGGPAILEECKRIRAERYPDGLPAGAAVATTAGALPASRVIHTVGPVWRGRSEEHTSELQSRENLVCRLLLE